MENNLLDLIFSTNLTLAKAYANIPVISDHAIVVTDIGTKPYYQKPTLGSLIYGQKQIGDTLTPNIQDMGYNKSNRSEEQQTFCQ